MTEIGAKQKEWAAFKYLVLSKSQQDYQKIKRLFRDSSWDAEKEQAFHFYLQHALAQKPKKGELLNAYQHIWGYFKKVASAKERMQYKYLLDTFSIENDELRPFFKELTLKYQEEYLLKSRLLFSEEK